MLALGAWAVIAVAQDGGTETINLSARITGFTPVDQAPEGDSPGDYGVLMGELSNGDKKVGQYQGFCVNITDPSNSQCTFTLVLPDGQIVLSPAYGDFNGDDGRATEPITGGTGDYADARGYAVGEETGEDTLTWTIHVSK